MRGWLTCAIAILAVCSTAVLADAHHPAITAFNAACINKGYSAQRIRTTMEAAINAPVSFEVKFWDRTLAPAPDAPDLYERRCEVAFEGDHVTDAIAALRAQMATPPVFGNKIPLPKTHVAQVGTALIEARELLVEGIAVVHIGTRGNGSKMRTFMSVDRLPADWRERLK